MEIKLIKALWGMEGSLENQFERIAGAGYTGVESPLPEKQDEARFRGLLEQYGLDYIAMVFTEGQDAAGHAASFEEQAERAAQFGPLLINSHSARDAMEYAEQALFFERALAAEQRLGVPVGHETHRGRAMFTPWAASRLLRDFPGLKLTSDFSHWVCVCERLLEDQGEHLALAISRTLHIHGRVGYAQGPQVPHPAAPEYAAELAAHETWWRGMAEAAAAEGRAVTFTPEFGPPGYMHTLPFTNRPVADLWDVCFWMGQRFKMNTP